MNIEEWLGEDNTLGKDILEKKYLQKGETLDEWFDRISGGNPKLKQLLVDKKFLFGGRILANRGLPAKGIKTTYSNCYVLSVDDSIESIYKTCGEIARTYSYGGGVGIDISKLRPRGAEVHNSAKETTGAVSFMKTFDVVTGTIGQNGRRGALMISLSVNHPDIEEFVDIKANTDQITNANISVRVTDTFMQAVEKDEDYILHWPCNNSAIAGLGYGQIMNHPDTPYDALVPVGELSEGILAVGNTGKTVGYFKRIKARDLFHKLAKNNWDYGEPGILYWNRISNYHLMANDPNFEYAGVNPCLTGDSLIQTTEGEIPIQQLVGTTPYVYCMDNEGNLTIRKAIKVWKTRENANLIEVITGKGKLRCTPDHRIYTTNRGWVEAKDLQHGDKIKGLNRQTTGHKYCSVGLSGTKYEKEHRFLARHFFDIEGMDVHHINDDGFDNRLSNLEVITHEEHSRLTNTGRLIETNRDENTGRYLCKEEHKSRDCKNLGKEVGTNWFVCEVRELDYTEDVYDMTVEDTHNFIANGFVVHNCAEEPLPDGGACLLGSINLAAYDNPLLDDNFSNDVRTAVIGLNEILEEGKDLHPLIQQKYSCVNYHQIGLGIMGLGDLLIKNQLTYGSQDACDYAKAVLRKILITAFMTSCDLNKDQKIQYEGMFDTEFYNKNILPYLPDAYKYVYPKNSQLMTIAPTGTISTMLRISGGAEPNFAFKYYRTTKSLHGEDVTYEVYHPAVDAYMKEHNVSTLEELPPYFVSSGDIPIANRIAMQSALQTQIDASISSTANLRNDVTVEQVEELYINAWKQGLKGITVFRDNCKRVAILSTHAQQTNNDGRKAPKRPKTLEADWYQVSAKGMLFNVYIGLYEGKPYEIFAKQSTEKSSITTGHGTITKERKGVYSWKNDKQEGIQSDSNIAIIDEESPERVATLLASLGLRHGADIKYIVKTLKKVNPFISSFTAAMIRVLNKYNTDPVIDTEEKCPECGNPITNEGGCQHCVHCGWSRCLILKSNKYKYED